MSKYHEVRAVSLKNEGRVMLNQPPAMTINWCCNLVILCFFTVFAASGVAADGKVTLQALTIYDTHEWFGLKPEVYFQCTDENKVKLPDVKAKNERYTFEGQESFQPLTTLVGGKCKRCGLYEEDSWNPDDVYDKWELCPSDFTAGPDGRYYRFKEDEFNLTLGCYFCSKSNGPQKNLPKKLTTFSGN
ncbi:hypothetical protein M758_11G031000 [Ceratodon purpureus]|nr:hypothetical protein M758_11G031000 [Ceratodon purpureus]